MGAVRSGASVALKVLFGTAILAWMIHSGKLDLSRVAASLSRWPVMLAILALCYAQAGIATLRWNLLLKAQQITLSFSRAWGLVMIGMLFNIVIPGAVGGDLVKGYYITQAAGPRKSHAATSILMDRVAGLIGLLLLGGVMVVANLNETMRSPATRGLGLLTVLGAGVGLASLYAIVFAGGWLSELTVMPRFARKVFQALGDYRNQRSVIPVALVLSMANQAVGFVMYYLALRTTGVTDMPIGQFFLAVPLGFITTALPLSPGGVGVGQAAFFGLFQMVAPAYAARASDALTVYQVIFILTCTTGLYWYISYKRPESVSPLE